MIEVIARLKGTRPLLMHNVQLANPLNPFAKQLKEVSGKRNKTEENYAEMAQIEFLGGLYWHKDTGPYVPGEWVFASLVEGARLRRQGKKIERGVIIGDEGDRNRLDYVGPRDPAELEQDANFVSVAPVRVGTARVMRTRPIFHTWSVEIPLYVDLDVIDFDELVAVAERAGRFIGIGDHRPMYGRYDALVDKV